MGSPRKKPGGRPRASSKLTLERLKEVLRYDPETGLFTWLKRISIRAVVGAVAGCPCPRGYVRIMIDGEFFHAHRLAWFYVNGTWPEGDLDHEKRDTSDNRIIKLRPATRTQNNGNSKLNKRNLVGLKGVSWRPSRQAYMARINVDKRSVFLGYFKIAGDAHAAYVAAAERYFGEFAHDGLDGKAA